LISPALRLASVVAANERLFGVTYKWRDEARAVAAELDFVARAPELAQHGGPALLVIGAEDDKGSPTQPRSSLPHSSVRVARQRSCASRIWPMP
jgi:hypothetical protein